MNRAVPNPAPDNLQRQQLLDAVASGLATQEGVADPVDFVTAYFARADTQELAERNASDLTATVAAQLESGCQRDVGEDVVTVFTPRPETRGFSAHGSTLVQVVTDDRPFLVDTISMNITRLGWSIRSVWHPEYKVKRDAHGRLETILPRSSTSRGLRESWICFEVYPELGKSADAQSPALHDAIAEGLVAVRAAVDDWKVMRKRGSETISMLDENAQPVAPHRVRGVINLLHWLFDNHFAFLGYREYAIEGTTFTPVPGTGLGILREEPDHEEFAAIAPGVDDEDILVVTKDSRRSPVHRNAYLDYIGVRVFDRQGNLVGEHRFLGLMTATAYTEPVARIPLLADKAEEIARRSEFALDSHAYNRLQQVVTTYPRDEFFQASVDELAPIISRAAALQERREVRLFLRPGTYGRFMSCMVYLPRDQYSTEMREKVQQLLKDQFGAEALDYHVSLAESPLARLFIVVKLPEEADMSTFDPEVLQRQLVEATRTWDDAFNAAAAELPAESRGVVFSEAYESDFDAETAVKDLQLANQLSSDEDLRFDLYAPADVDAADLRFKVFAKRPMSLTVVMPHLAALGVDVTNERPYKWDVRGETVLVYDFGFRLPTGQTLADWADADRRRFCDAFAASYRGVCEAGRLTKLVMSARLTWQQVVYLRSISRYLQQAGIPFSQTYVAMALTSNPTIAAALVGAFETKFDPTKPFADIEARREAFEKAAARVEASLDEVASLDHDRILRMYLAVLRAMLRTNAFAEDRPALAFKLAPRELALLPDPKPKFEIFVYSPEVHGVHLRFGNVARGGLRWSDRAEDFRTEILGLVKAQMVKNTVIVPVGAKGGFVPQNLVDASVDRAAWQAGGIATYKIFINSLLSLTDNIVDGVVVPPKDVIRFDSDDPYLVVAADKGTATFSDTANGIAIERGFWLGDAFASGGSVGYDHKGMGITARGAWESVKRHFFEMGRDCQTADFTCVGIGDMAGDVFGNGMLLSRHTKLVAAFNHMHIFLDPNPDPETSFVERERLFNKPRSTWADYDAKLISAGGGVYPRAAKSIPVSGEVRAALGLPAGVTKLTPNDLINAILKAPVDLLWNGGIGTYVKASTETNAECGDKANDAVRVSGNEVRAKVAGEGGNLGWTQRGRVEFAQSGGHVNTDFIDNSAGVDTSDHEVNIKILLAQEVAAGRLTMEQRNELLASMTDEVAKLVLAHNVDQNLALACATYRAPAMAASHEAWMRVLEENGRLDRAIEYLPSRKEMSQRIAEGRGLTRPELSTLLAYTKIWLADLILESDLPDDPYLADRLITYFPKPLRERYAGEMPKHRLHREIIATVTVNRFVDSQGITSYYRLANEIGADIASIVRAQLAARNILQVAKLERDISSKGVAAEADAAVRVEMRRMVERATRWLLNNRRGKLSIRDESSFFLDGVATVFAHQRELMTPRHLAGWEAKRAALIADGVQPELAGLAAEARYVHMALPIVQIAARLNRDVMVVARAMFRLSQGLKLDVLFDRVAELPVMGRWDLMAQAALHDDLQQLETDLTAAALEAAPEASEAEEIFQAWRAKIGGADTELRTLGEISEGPADLARLSVALRTLRALLA